jgi:uncharacterized repeat protein (TIGR03803 family)
VSLQKPNARLLLVIGCVAALAMSASAGTIWSFSGPDGQMNSSSANVPQNGLLRIGNVLYGTANGGGAGGPVNGQGAGVIFKLTPPGPVRTTWTQSIIYSFCSLSACADGQTPNASLVFYQGAFYGTTVAGGQFDSGVVFKLTPPGRGQTKWNYVVLYSFMGGADGRGPVGPLVVDKTGSLYGTTSSGGGQTCGTNDTGYGPCGTVFRLTPPTTGGAAWNEDLIYLFPTGGANGANPTAGLAYLKGDYFGTTTAGGTYNLGVIFELMPPPAGQTAWTETVLHNFAPKGDALQAYAGLLVNDGALFGVTGGSTDAAGAGACSDVYKLSRSSAKTGWLYTILYQFGSNPLNACGADAPLIMKGGILYGTSSGGGQLVAGGGLVRCGTVFKVSADTSSPTGWTGEIVYAFHPPTCAYPGPNPIPDDGGDPVTALIDGGSTLYGMTSSGGTNNLGTVFSVLP